MSTEGVMKRRSNLRPSCQLDEGWQERGGCRVQPSQSEECEEREAVQRNRAKPNQTKTDECDEHNEVIQ